MVRSERQTKGLQLAPAPGLVAVWATGGGSGAGLDAPARAPIPCRSCLVSATARCSSSSHPPSSQRSSAQAADRHAALASRQTAQGTRMAASARRPSAAPRRNQLHSIDPVSIPHTAHFSWSTRVAATGLARRAASRWRVEFIHIPQLLRRMIPDTHILTAVRWQIQMLRCHPRVQDIQSLSQVCVLDAVDWKEAEEALQEFGSEELLDALE
jgi:hypothetical protein